MQRRRLVHQENNRAYTTTHEEWLPVCSAFSGRLRTSSFLSLRLVALFDFDRGGSGFLVSGNLRR